MSSCNLCTVLLLFQIVHYNFGVLMRKWKLICTVILKFIGSQKDISSIGVFIVSFQDGKIM